MYHWSRRAKLRVRVTRLTELTVEMFVINGVLVSMGITQGNLLAMMIR